MCEIKDFLIEKPQKEGKYIVYSNIIKKFVEANYVDGKFEVCEIVLNNVDYWMDLPIIPQKMELLTIADAIKELKNGKSISNINFKNGEYIKIDPNFCCVFFYSNSVTVNFYFVSEHILSDKKDWFVV